MKLSTYLLPFTLSDATWKLELCREYEAVVCIITNNIGVLTGT